MADAWKLAEAESSHVENHLYFLRIESWKRIKKQKPEVKVLFLQFFWFFFFVLIFYLHVLMQNSIKFFFINVMFSYVEEKWFQNVENNIKLCVKARNVDNFLGKSRTQKFYYRYGFSDLLRRYFLISFTWICDNIPILKYWKVKDPNEKKVCLKVQIV